jgi:hypothetical protein
MLLKRTALETHHIMEERNSIEESSKEFDSHTHIQWFIIFFQITFSDCYKESQMSSSNKCHNTEKMKGQYFH